MSIMKCRNKIRTLNDQYVLRIQKRKKNRTKFRRIKTIICITENTYRKKKRQRECKKKKPTGAQFVCFFSKDLHTT